MWAPALAALTVTAVVLVLLHRSRLRGRYRVPPAAPVEDRVLLGAGGAGVVGFAVLLVAGVDVTAAAAACAALVAVAFLVRGRHHLRWRLVPWRLVLLVGGLFLLIESAHRHGLGPALAEAAGSGTALPDLLRLAGAAAAGANVVNNLPAYLALEPAAGGSPERLLAVLVGVDTGPMLTVWGSLATLLWLERCHARDVRISARSFATAGLLLTPAVVVATTAALVVT
jgi:arsenical pump membrane protein